MAAALQGMQSSSNAHAEGFTMLPVAGLQVRLTLSLSISLALSLALSLSSSSSLFARLNEPYYSVSLYLSLFALLN